MSKKRKHPSFFGDMDDLLAWKKEWVGMPEFEQEDLMPFKSIEVKLKTKDDKDAFATLVEQKITNRTKSLWYPESKREDLLSKKCIDKVLSMKNNELKKVARIKPLGDQTPWVWSIEPVHGCNLRCGHCSHALDKEDDYTFMSKETWVNTFKILNEISPTTRIDLCISGEPTLHPHLVEFLKIGRDLAPLSQIQITTNGTMLAKGKVTHKELLEAGANIVYVDMYAPKKLHIKLAEESGYEWYEYYVDGTKQKKRSPWTYWGPDLKMIVLQEQPDNWPKSRYKAGLMGTWYNHLDWDKARKYGLKPVTKPLTRRCNQPFLYVPVHATGNYMLCCQDNWGETAGLFGSVNEGGVNGFKKFWYGKELQTIRRRLRQKNRADTSYCSRCCITFSRCDFKHWTDDQVDVYYDGTKWYKMPPYESSIPIKDDSKESLQRLL